MANLLSTTTIGNNINDYSSRQLGNLLENKINNISMALENMALNLNRFNKDLINKAELDMLTNSDIGLLRTFISDLRFSQIEIETVSTVNVKLI